MNGFQLNYLGLLFYLLGLLIVNIIRVLKSFVKGLKGFFVESFVPFSFGNLMVMLEFFVVFVVPIAGIFWVLGLFLGVFGTAIDFFLLCVSTFIFVLTILGLDQTKHTLVTRLYSQIPIIGYLLHIEAIIELLKDGSFASLSLLVRRFSGHKNCQTLAFVLNWLGHIKKQSSIDSICKIWTNTRNKNLEKLLVKEKWVASTPVNVRVLSALKTKQLKFITNGGQEVIEPLLNALQDKDYEIANQANKCAILFDKTEYQESLYRLIIEQDHPIARQVVITSQYLPKDPVQKALFYFMTEQWDKYESLDHKNSLLQKGYELGNEKLRKQIADKARQAGRVEWIQIVAGGRKGQRLREMTDAEWETTLNVLSNGKQWEEMWGLAQKAPAIWSKQLLQMLKQVGWLPSVGEERVGFERLKQLAHKYLGTIPLKFCQESLTGHTGSVWGISFSPDGQLLASYSEDKTIRLWQMPGGQLLATLTGHTVRIKQISFSPDGQLLASYSPDQIIRLWQMPDGQLLATLTGHTARIKQISFSPDGQLLASCSEDKTIRLWQMPDGQPLATLTGTGHDNWVNGITFSPDGKLLASCSEDKTIRLWQMPGGQLLATLTGHTGSVSGISFSPDGQLLASCSEDKTIRLWSSDVLQLSRLPIKQLSQQNRERVQKALQDSEITERERHWLEFIQALMDWHQRFDVEVEDAPQLVNTGEFDIEIEG